jgi:hypothetical protein
MALTLPEMIDLTGPDMPVLRPKKEIIDLRDASPVRRVPVPIPEEEGDGLCYVCGRELTAAQKARGSYCDACDSDNEEEDSEEDYEEERPICTCCGVQRKASREDDRCDSCERLKWGRDRDNEDLPSEDEDDVSDAKYTCPECQWGWLEDKDDSRCQGCADIRAQTI